ncbi:DNA-binding transcriptional LysR family regulator [Bacillus fengqiuensis]|nr:DNA-binding transcriptional LysR family regulator [Bacillus fengqiuensis]
MDVRQLQYFYEVAKQKSFTKAAEVLHISQPSLSKMVKSLEDEIGIKLIDRSGKRIQLTDAGEIVFQQAEAVLRSLNDLSNSLYDLMNLKRGTIKFGIPPIIGTLFFPRIMKSFRDSYPLIHIQMIEFGAKKMERIVEQGEVDVGVVLLPVDDTKFEFIPFAKEKLQVVMPKKHSFSKRKFVSLTELKDESFIMFHEDFSMHEIIYNECLRAGFQPNIAYTSSQWDFIGEMVAANLGIALFPQSICQKLNHDQVSIIDLDDIIPWELGLIIKKDRYISIATKAFLDHLQSNFLGLS